MSKSPRKQAKRAARARQKRREAHRPKKPLLTIDQFLSGEGAIECHAAGDLASDGWCRVLLIKRLARASGLVSIDLDRGVAGMVQTEFLVPASLDDIDDALDDLEMEDAPPRRASLAEVRGWCLGAVRWSEDHGVAALAGWPLIARLIGVGIDDWKTADTTGFVAEYVGIPDDIRPRLRGQSLVEFLARTDIALPLPLDRTAEEGSQYARLLEETADKVLEDLSAGELATLREIAEPFTRRLHAAVTARLRDHHVVPAGELFKVCQHRVLAQLLLSAMDLADATEEDWDQVLESITVLLDGLLVPEDRRESYLAADRQFVQAEELDEGFVSEQDEIYVDAVEQLRERNRSTLPPPG